MKRIIAKSAKKAAKKTAQKTVSRKTPAKKVTAKKAARNIPMPSPQPFEASPDSIPQGARVRVIMFRHGLGDCHLLTFPREGRRPFHILIDCGALDRSKKDMIPCVTELESLVSWNGGDPRIDIVVVTHEHKDHLSGFNQAREIFDRIEIGGVWMGWTENPDDEFANQFKTRNAAATADLNAALSSNRLLGIGDALDDLKSMMAFTEDTPDQPVGRRTISDALEYVRKRGIAANHIRYFDPGTGPVALDGVPGIGVYVLGPPRDRQLLLSSEVTKSMETDGTVYHLSGGLASQIAANRAALNDPSSDAALDVGQPFAPEHRITRTSRWWPQIQEFVKKTYDKPSEKWRQIEFDWVGAFDHFALKLDNDTNNTSLVLAFEIEATGEVLLFVGDAQVGNWRSWENVRFDRPGSPEKLAAHDLLKRTVFYKVGHHGSHNATLKKAGLELMQSKKLVGFIPLDKATAAKQGRKDPSTNQPKGWKMPASALHSALLSKTKGRLVLSDATENLSPEAEAAGVVATPTYIQYWL